MSPVAAEPKILRPRTSVRYLKLIAIFKILNGVLLLILGFSLLFLNSRTRWLDAISTWTDEEILLAHSRPVLYLLNKLQDVVVDGQLRAPAFLALFYSAVLFVEGFGVYFQKRWAELLMVLATGGLIPVEAWHLWHRPSLVATLILVVNCFIVWFVYSVLRRDAHHAPGQSHAVEVVAETR